MPQSEQTCRDTAAAIRQLLAVRAELREQHASASAESLVSRDVDVVVDDLCALMRAAGMQP